MQRVFTRLCSNRRHLFLRENRQQALICHRHHLHHQRKLQPFQKHLQPPRYHQHHHLSYYRHRYYPQRQRHQRLQWIRRFRRRQRFRPPPLQ